MRHVKPDAVVADVSIPGDGGSALLRAIRALKPEDGGNVPAVVVFDEDGGGATAGRATASGFAARLTRPLDPWELCRTIATLVSPV
jgi:CheY-like chemotaxis protein